MIPLLDSLRKRLSGRFATKRDEIEIIMSVKQLYAGAAMAAAQDDLSLLFLRRLNAARTVRELWSLRDEFFLLVARSTSELEAMRQTEGLLALFQPAIAANHIRPGETQALGSRFGMTTRGPD